MGLLVLGPFTLLAGGALAGAVLSAEQSLNWLLLSCGSSGSQRILAAHGAVMLLTAPLAAVFGILLGVLQHSAPPLALRLNTKKLAAAGLKAKPDMDKDLALKQLNAGLKLVRSRTAPTAPIGQMQAGDWEMTLSLMKDYQELKTDMKADAFYSNSLLPK